MAKDFLLYFHIPFCESKCGYCAFNSSASHNQYKEAYAQRLLVHLEQKLQENPEARFSSLYIGGGTPNVLNESLYTPIFKRLEGLLKSDCEINIEANPNTLNFSWLKELKNLGVNRLSLGIQSFLDCKLEFLERNHKPKNIFKSFEIIDKVGISNVSVDLIYGTPFCTKKHLEYEIKEASKLPINHLSAYGLSIDEGSAFAKNPQKQSQIYHQGDFEGFLSLGHFIKALLEAEGFYQYEVSNYSKGYKSRHNLGYWEGKDYLGIGAGAVGCIENIRTYPSKDIVQYLEDLSEEQEILTPKDKALERLFLGMRCEVGVEESQIPQKEHLEILKQENKVWQRAERIYNRDYFLGDEIALFLS